MPRRQKVSKPSQVEFEYCFSSFQNQTGHRMRGIFSKVAAVASSMLIYQSGGRLVFWGISILFWLKILYCIITLLIVIVAGDLGYIFLVFLFLDSGVDIYYRKIVAATLSAISASRISLVLVLLIRLVLVGRKLLMLATKCVSKGSISELSSSRVFFLLFCGPVLLRTPWVYLADTEKRL